MTEQTYNQESSILRNATTVAYSLLRMGNGQRGQALRASCVPGASTSFPVTAVKQGFSKDFLKDSHRYFNRRHYLDGGDHTLVYNLKLNEFMPVACSRQNDTRRPLMRRLNPKIGLSVSGLSTDAECSLDQYLADPASRVQGLIMIDKGEVVYEQYPGMNPSDHHVLMSLSRITVNIVFAQLVSEGVIDLNKSVSVYVSELRESNWDFVSVHEALNMATGLDIEETFESLTCDHTNISSFYDAVLTQSNDAFQRPPRWLDIARHAQRIPGEPSGHVVRPSSIISAVLTYLVEGIENTAWSDIFEKRVWSKVMADQSMMFAMSPDGLALTGSLAIATLEDTAKLALLLTPSWACVSTEKVVSEKSLGLILNGGLNTCSDEMRKARYSSFQFGSVQKSGLLSMFGLFGQGVVIDVKRDFVAIYFSSNSHMVTESDDTMIAYIKQSAAIQEENA